MMFGKKKLMAAIALAMVSSFALSGCGGDAKKDAGKAAAPAASDGKKIVLRYAENQPKDYPTTAAARKFADIVKEKTKGRITVEVRLDPYILVSHRIFAAPAKFYGRIHLH